MNDKDHIDEQHIEHTYLTDDLDTEQRAELVVAWAPNGDYYVGSRPEGDRILFNSVRICTRGGAAAANPRLVKAVQDLFQALGGWEQPQVDNQPRVRDVDDIARDLKRELPKIAAEADRREQNDRTNRPDLTKLIFK